MTRDEARAKCFKAMKRAMKRSSLDCSLWSESALDELAKIVFDALATVPVRVNLPEATEEIKWIGWLAHCDEYHRPGSTPHSIAGCTFAAMSTTGDLTNPPKPKGVNGIFCLNPDKCKPTGRCPYDPVCGN